ncbi:hypothetical protein LOTGIDRAFT_228702 [Lottia gigantea]|uniref:Uncharacterized protein n=1 Tax=Lottia gigantea TaxID=225164 RepID=V4A7W7_LOTGI|nr:hypothetical protein LOTGIDRAFT_228702 [Lottia gigantea]ESO91140.1 hypothetical protein LOTGIDRAFT_228702 [Lottia gigantea]
MAIKQLLAAGCFVVLVVLFDLATCQQGSNSQCQQTFVNNAMKCVQNGSVNYQNLLYLTSNRSRGSAPPEGTEAFKNRACLSRMTIDSCGKMIAATMRNSTMCMSPMEQQQLMLTAASIFGEFDRVCAHPCRYTLTQEIRQCFSYSMKGGNSQINPQTFLDEASRGRGSIIGSTHEQVHDFCLNRQSLLSCIKNKINICPDGQYMMKKMKIDIMSLERAFDLLCQHPNVYLHGLQCFNDPTQEVQVCYREMDNKLTNMQILERQQTLTDQQIYMQECSIRLSLMDCEMGAWRRRQHAPCHPAILGLHTELECRLLPDYCMNLFPSLVQQHCSPMNFHQEQRAQFAGAASTTITLTTLFAMLFVSVFARS